MRTRLFTVWSLVATLIMLLLCGVPPVDAQRPESIVVTLQMPPRRAAVDSSGFDLVQMDEFSDFASPGDPALPGKVYNIAMPPDVAWQSVTVEIVGVKTVELDGTYDIAPVPPPTTWADGRQIIAWGENAASIVNGKNTRVYQRDAYFPSSYGSLANYAQMRKWRFARVLVTPIQYNPVTKKLQMATEVQIRISFGRGPTDSARRGIELNDTVMDYQAAQILQNFDQAKGWYQPDTPPMSPNVDADYVIITTNTIVAGSSKLNNFVAHKQSKGHTVEIITETQYSGLTGQSPNGTAEKIRQWLINNYQTQHIRSVLLIGNPDPGGDVPMKMCWPRRYETGYQEAPTDYFYADLTGNWDLDGDQYFCEIPDDIGSGGVDSAAEVYVGRIPVYTSVSGWATTLDSILQKTMDYENSSSVAWRKSALLPMSFSDSSTDGALMAERMKSDYLNGAGFSSYTLYQHLTTGCNSSYSSNENLVNSAVRTRWQNNDYGIVTWWGHGNNTGAYIGYGSCSDGTIFTSSDAPVLDNAHPSFVYQNSCLNGYPEDASNLGYAILKNGAIATVSASRVSWYNPGSWSPHRWGDNASIGYYYTQRIANGEQAGVALFTEKGTMVPGTSDSLWMNLFDFNLYGDPTISLSSTAPGMFSKTSPSNGATGQSTSPTLSWGSSSGATSYEYCYDTVNNSSCDGTWTSTTSTSANLSGLSASTTYYWQVRARNTAGTTDASGGWWSFITQAGLPGAFSKTSPSNGATGQSTSPTLSWGSSSGATSYEYCYDTVNNSSCDGTWTSTTNASAGIGPLSNGTTYYWQVRARNAAGTTDASGGWWSFTTTGTVPNDDFNNAFVISSVPYSYSQNTTGATTASDDPSFTCGGTGQKWNSVWYRYTPTTTGIFTVNTFGSSYDTVLAIWTGTRGALQSQGCNDDSSGFQSQVNITVTVGTTYYVEIAGYSSSAAGTLDLAASLTSFPGTFSKTGPSNGATGQSTSPTLSWGSSSAATSYEYCYDTVNNSSCDGTWTSTTNTSTGIGPLSNGTTYYWQVRARNAVGTTDADSGTWWNFTTTSTSTCTQPTGAPPAVVAIPDTGEWVGKSILVADAPANARVTDVRLKYKIQYPNPENLEIRLVHKQSGRNLTVWDHQSANGQPLARTVSNLSAFSGVPANGEWILQARSTKPGQVGTLEEFSVLPLYQYQGPTLRVAGTGAKGTPLTLRIPEGAKRVAVQSKSDKPNGATSALPLNAAQLARLAAGWQVIKYESFEGAYPNSGWSLYDQSADGYDRYWDDDDYKSYTGSWAGWPANGGANALDPAVYCYPNNMDTWMVYGPFDLSDAADADTYFNLWREIETGHDHVFFGVSTDGNNFNGLSWDGNAGWEFKDIYYTGYVGNPSVWVAWHFFSDSSGAYQGPWVDDVVIWKYVSPPNQFYLPFLRK